LLASDFNAEIRDPIAALSGAWNTWTTRIDQATSTFIGHTATYARYVRVGSLVIVQFKLTLSGAGTAGVIITSMPVTPAAYGVVVGSGDVVDGGTHYPAVLSFSSGTSIEFRRTDATSTTNVIGADPSFALASGDILTGAIVYEAA
jgi:hypothetical protein